MILEQSIKIKNYKCFGEDEQGFEKVYPLNIIIGKNNSGKSTLIDLIGFAVNPSIEFFKLARNGFFPSVLISKIITEGDLVKAFKARVMNAEVEKDYKNMLIGKRIEYSLDSDGRKGIVFSEQELLNDFQDYLLPSINKPFEGKTFRRIPPERDIKMEGNDQTNLTISPEGVGATNIIRQIVLRSNLNTNIIKKELLFALNSVVNPDINFVDILPQEHDGGIVEIYLEDSENGLIALSKMGSGIKTILLVLLNLIVIPKAESHRESNYVFCFEEIENNLHAALQRRLFNYISDYSKKHKTYFFITTQSSIAIDLFIKDSNAQIIHTIRERGSSISKTLETDLEGRNIIRDLDVRASDLLLSNGIIWVEGPSDVVYLELFLALFSTKFNKVQKLNYCIQSLSTAIWKYAGFTDFDWSKIDESLDNQIISLAKTNHNNLIVIDRDNNYEDKKPSEYESFTNGTGKNKARLINELMKFGNHNEDMLESNFGDTNAGRLFFWINEGTIETYLDYFISN